MSHTLEVLDISQNQICSDSLHELGRMLVMNNSLKKLLLAFNTPIIYDSGIVLTFAKAIEYNTNLEYLNISDHNEQLFNDIKYACSFRPSPLRIRHNSVLYNSLNSKMPSPERREASPDRSRLYSVREEHVEAENEGYASSDYEVDPNLSRQLDSIYHDASQRSPQRLRSSSADRGVSFDFEIRRRVEELVKDIAVLFIKTDEVLMGRHRSNKIPTEAIGHRY
eukprot:CAMPEP_0115032506 /NCGR_PEP_ID=MMETSP0216-20121206/39202_1 /TAXON_ID=223996 /ORGANISM="Protocruzia adherens, Strain Boccale" /LENGTH=222 /DNA_ID=CAMNT_0002410425 /DNA_START=280 /DNA_END=949 /DNA_ORIENTATION=+